MSRLKKIGIVTAAVVVLGGAAASWLFVDVMARHSSFCSNCHYMQPYVEQWKDSPHRGVECVKCHPTQRSAMFGQFVKYITGTYSTRPRAFVPDSACLASGCHTGMNKSKSVKFMGVSFPHRQHLGMTRRGIRLRCASCHGSSQQAGHVSVAPGVCFLCHFKGQGPTGTLSGCRSCHGAPSGMTKHGGFLFDMKAYVKSGVQCSRCHVTAHQGEGAVSKTKCFTCHVSHADKITDVAFVHQKHVTQHEIRCAECHEPIRHGNIKVLSVLNVSCESCHANLHSATKEMYLGVGAKGPQDLPSRMFAAQINCTGCHTEVRKQGGSTFLGQGTMKANPKSCAVCHDSRFIPMVNQWKRQGRLLASEAARMAAVGKAAAAGAKHDPEAKKLAGDLEFNARFLKQGHPVHNIEYAIRIVQADQKILSKIEKSAGRPVQTKIQPEFARGDFSFCTPTCHRFIPRKQPYNFQGVDFPHSFHVDTVGLDCGTCHEAGKHKVMALSSPKDCAPCHHTGEKTGCARCHSRQAELYHGKVPASLDMKVPPDVMSGTVACADCHDPANPDALATVAKACSMCHSDQGAKNLAAWKKSLKAGRTQVNALAQQARLTIEMLNRRHRDTSAFKKRFGRIQERIDFIEKARGVHNQPAASEQYKRAAAELQALINAMEGLPPGTDY
jgi:hypothetical protein